MSGSVLWGQGKVLFNEGAGVFESPAAVARRTGQLRCNIDTADVESAQAVVRYLEGQGYRVEHRLAEQEGLQRLGRMLVCLVLLFVASFATCAGITVLISNALHLASKTHEIGILRAHGLSAAQVVALFAVQGGMAGLAAFVVGGALAALVEPLASEVVRATFRLPGGSLADRLVQMPYWGLFGLALVLAVSATTLGGVLPALRACRLSPVQALQRQD